MSIRVNGLTKIYGAQKAVNNISFAIEDKGITGFLGPNGAGKSTTMKMLTCYLKPTSGNAEIAGINIIKNPIAAKKKIGYLAESNPLYHHMYVKEFLLFTARLFKLNKKSNAVNRAIELTGLQHEWKKKIGDLSKGYKQRVGIAQAIIHQPEVLILDEPISGLDPNQLVEIRQLILQLAKESTILFSSHIMQEIEALCNRIIVINNGEIIADNTKEAIIQSVIDESVVLITFEEQVSEQSLKQLNNINDIKKIDEKTFHLLGNDAQLIKKEVFQWAAKNNKVILTLLEKTGEIEDAFKFLTRRKKENA